jgi:hypothetical protein
MKGVGRICAFVSAHFVCAFVIVSGLFLTGCSPREHVKDFDASRFKQGESFAEVRERFGKPFVTFEYSLNEVSWSYFPLEDGDIKGSGWEIIFVNGFASGIRPIEVRETPVSETIERRR